MMRCRSLLSRRTERHRSGTPGAHAHAPAKEAASRRRIDRSELRRPQAVHPSTLYYSAAAAATTGRPTSERTTERALSAADGRPTQRRPTPQPRVLSFRTPKTDGHLTKLILKVQHEIWELKAQKALQNEEILRINPPASGCIRCGGARGTSSRRGRARSINAASGLDGRIPRPRSHSDVQFVALLFVLTSVTITIANMSAAEAATAAPKATPKKASPKKKAAGASKAKAPASHPTYQAMIKAAITHLKEAKGSSRAALLKYILQNYKVGDNVKLVNSRIRAALKRGVTAGGLKQVKGTGASGSFRLGDKAKKAAVAKPKKAKKAAKPKKAAAEGAAAKPKKAKKPATPKKAAAAKKPKTPKKKASPKKPKAAKKSPAKKAAKPKKASPKKAAKPKKAAPKKAAA
uniref:H15 domain-containing protein n=1 Tax=Plectus sambesii TaxID=2011161 RepID=A0A914XAA3_9BILA